MNKLLLIIAFAIDSLTANAGAYGLVFIFNDLCEKKYKKLEWKYPVKSLAMLNLMAN